MPVGILGSLAICRILCILLSRVLTGIAPSLDFIDPKKGAETSLFQRSRFPHRPCIGPHAPAVIPIPIREGDSELLSA
jgi:hypothetical protein